MNPLNCSMLLLSLALSTTSCNDYVPSAPTQVIDLVKVSGGGKDLTVRSNADRIDSLVVLVLDRHGQPVNGVQVTWAQTDPASTVEPATSTTGADGTAWARWTLAGLPGVHTASAKIADRPAQTFSFRIRSWTAAAFVKGTNGHQCAVGTDEKLACSSGSGPLISTLVSHRFIDLDAVASGLPKGNVMCALAYAGRVWCADMTQSALTFAEVTGAHPPFHAMAAGGGNTFCAVTSTAELWCWGSSRHGLRADGVTTGGFAPTPIRSNYLGGVPLRDVVLADDVGCTVTVDGVPWCWGSNLTGIVAPDTPGTDTEAAPPRPVVLPEPITTLSLTGDGSGACGIGWSGRAICWGLARSSGGVTSTGQFATPGFVASAERFTTVAPTRSGHVALTRGGVLYVWGSIWSGHFEEAALPLRPPFTGGIRFEKVFTHRAMVLPVCTNMTGGGGTICLEDGSALWQTTGIDMAARIPWIGLRPPVTINRP